MMLVLKDVDHLPRRPGEVANFASAQILSNYETHAADMKSLGIIMPCDRGVSWRGISTRS